MSDLIEHIKGEYQSKTAKASTICRTIVFGMIGTIWLFFRKDNVFIFNPQSCFALLLFIIYLSIDVFQYFATSVCYGFAFFFQGKLKDPDKFIDIVDLSSFIIFSLKIIYLFIIMIIVIINAWFNGPDIIKELMPN